MAGDTSHTWINAFLFMALFMPLFSFILSALISKKYAWLVAATASLIMFLAALSACYVFAILFRQTGVYSIDINWFSIGHIKLNAGILLDRQAIIMLPVVTIISFLVHIYSTGYMADDKDINRYFAMLGFFTFSMLGIVMANSMLLIFVFWELVGFSSYLLIGHWTAKKTAAAAAKKAFIFNRIGDVGFLIGLMLLWTHTGSFSLQEIYVHSAEEQWQTITSLCFFCGVIGKSAQFPLLTWLPDAMEGPTPVSALIHAATMVAAGVFLLARIFFLFTPEALNVVAVIGALTSLMASCAALVQYDIKKVLAYSTISQLGFMVLAIGVGDSAGAMTHLFTHAFFKAGLFLGAGAVIHSLHQLEQQTHQHFDVQSLHNLGGLGKYLPVTCMTFLICSAALAGLPFFSGFLSKDAILSAVWNWNDGSYWKWVITLTAFSIPFLTVMYTFRLVWFVFFGEIRLARVVQVPLSISEVPIVMRLPLILLSACSFWMIISINPFDFTGWLYGSLHRGPQSHNTMLTWLSAVWVITAAVLAYFLFRSASPAETKTPLKSFAGNSFYLDSLYKKTIVFSVRHFSLLTERLDTRWVDGAIHLTAYAQVMLSHVAGWIDKFFIDGIVNGVAGVARLTGSFVRSFQGGKIQLYIFWAVFGIIIFLIWMLV